MCLQDEIWDLGVKKCGIWDLGSQKMGDLGFGGQIIREKIWDLGYRE